MLSATLSKRLEGIADASTKGYPIRNLYRLMYEQELWIQAYANIHTNAGATTKGVDDLTLDGFSHARIDRLIQQLRQGTYRPRPVRRTYVPKANGKVRPLGIPNGDDKLVQEVLRIILERIYEPIFSDASHGFRKGRSCHTALSRVGSYWNGTKWLINVDLRSCFDVLDHDKLLELLQRRIADKRFLKICQMMLKAGYVEDWQYHGTYSGAPQGGVVSPMCMNVYLHELDRFVAKLQQTFDRGTVRRWNPEYQHHLHKVYTHRKRIDALKATPSCQTEVARLHKEIAVHGKLMRSIPTHDMTDPNFKRLRYLWYADDALFGVIGSKAEAEQLLSQVRSFLTQELHLEVNEEKTHICHIADGCEFLGYHVRQAKTGKVIKGNRRGRYTRCRTTSAIVSLYIPDQVPARFCHEHKYGDYGRMESHHRTNLIVPSIPEIIATYNAELRGLTEYYALACDVKVKLTKLFYLAHHSLYKTLANKLRIQSMTRVIRMLRQKDGEMVYFYTAKGKTYGMKVYHLKHLDRKGKG